MKPSEHTTQITNKALLSEEEVEALQTRIHNSYMLNNFGIYFFTSYYILIFTFMMDSSLFTLLIPFIVSFTFLVRLIIIFLQKKRFYDEESQERAQLKWKTVIWTLLVYGTFFLFSKEDMVLFLWGFAFLLEVHYISWQIESVFDEVIRRRNLKQLRSANRIYRLTTTITSLIVDKIYNPASEGMLDAGPIQCFEEYILKLANKSRHLVSQEEFDSFKIGDFYSYTETKHLLES